MFFVQLTVLEAYWVVSRTDRRSGSGQMTEQSPVSQEYQAVLSRWNRPVEVSLLGKASRLLVGGFLFVFEAEGVHVPWLSSHPTASAQSAWF